MARMRTFFLYFLGIVGFMFLSFVLENGLIENMYKKMSGQIIPSSSNIAVEDVTGKASNVNGFMSFNLVNNSSSNLDNQYIKIDLYSKQGLLAATKYVRVQDVPASATKTYQVKFKGNEIRGYEISLVSELPDKTNIINILGWEIDLTDVFGFDLSNLRIFGVKVASLFSMENLQTAGSNAWNWSAGVLASVPWWGYAIASGIILWYMPKGFLFGVFPF